MKKMLLGLILLGSLILGGCTSVESIHNKKRVQNDGLLLDMYTTHKTIGEMANFGYVNTNVLSKPKKDTWFLSVREITNYSKHSKNYLLSFLYTNNESFEITSVTEHVTSYSKPLVTKVLLQKI